MSWSGIRGKVDSPAPRHLVAPGRRIRTFKGPREATDPLVSPRGDEGEDLRAQIIESSFRAAELLGTFNGQAEYGSDMAEVDAVGHAFGLTLCGALLRGAMALPHRVYALISFVVVSTKSPVVALAGFGAAVALSDVICHGPLVGLSLGLEGRLKEATRKQQHHERWRHLAKSIASIGVGWALLVAVLLSALRPILFLLTESAEVRGFALQAAGWSAPGLLFSALSACLHKFLWHLGSCNPTILCSLAGAGTHVTYLLYASGGTPAGAGVSFSLATTVEFFLLAFYTWNYKYSLGSKLHSLVPARVAARKRTATHRFGKKSEIFWKRPSLESRQRPPDQMGEPSQPSRSIEFPLETTSGTVQYPPEPGSTDEEGGRRAMSDSGLPAGIDSHRSRARRHVLKELEASKILENIVAEEFCCCLARSTPPLSRRERRKLNIEYIKEAVPSSCIFSLEWVALDLLVLGSLKLGDSNASALMIAILTNNALSVLSEAMSHEFPHVARRFSDDFAATYQRTVAVRLELRDAFFFACCCRAYSQRRSSFSLWF